ncbi:DUF342 domain-containing protein [Vibrio sp. SCSIO 43140]|uniref:DUF342 domain-containing protein n=1 Tax=Vibrio sp. SCSIO 43140 TaxID=2819100 RepID=UPI002074DBF6|nr:FapA family protein [Vibrio sp. SCSIO 43140]USD63036.1 DUF342 domain-containing protein [Vibrio sp. SCSIO 43140]
MWKSVLSLSSDQKQVFAQLPKEYEQGLALEVALLGNALKELNAEAFFVDETSVIQFIKSAQAAKGDAFSGLTLAQVKNATAEVILSEQDMLASIKVEGAYGGDALTPTDIISALTQARVVKGINKKALKKVLLLSQQLKSGESYTQPVAIGKRPKEGKDAQFIPLVADPKDRVLKPQASGPNGKVDMRDLGAVVTVGENEQVMRRIPAKPGENGYTVTGAIIPPRPVKDLPLKPGAGTRFSPDNPNTLLSTMSGMPVIKASGVEIDEALCLSKVDISTGHIKFKGSVVISGNVEPNMEVTATGAITVGGFVESASLKAKGDIAIAKGIIGHNVDDGEPKSCHIESGGDVVANYAQFATIKARGDVQFTVHSLNNDIACSGDLLVTGGNKKQGTLSGGEAKVGGKVICNQLGVEGDTATYIEAFANYKHYAEKFEELQSRYTALQEQKMVSIRREIELKKIPKSSRTEEQNAELAALNSADTEAIDKLNEEKERIELELYAKLELNTVESLVQTHTRVTVQFDDEKVTTKSTHGPATFSYNKQIITFAPKLKEEDILV